MKRVFALTLALLLALSLVACGGGEGGSSTQTTAAETGLKEGQLQVGYGKVNITPELSLPLGGYGNTLTRMSDGFADYLYATCFAVTDAEGNTVIAFGLDMIATGPALYKTAREKISQKHGIPVENIIMSASHNHSSPDMGANHPNVGKWATQLIDLLVKCADQALEDRAPAEIYCTTVTTEGLNFIRRYKLEDNTVCGYQSIIAASGLAVVGYESEADRTMQLLKFEREADKKDILVANFQTHPHRFGSATNPIMSADLVGAFRAEVEEKMGYDVVYFTGASGNLNPTSLIKEHNITSDHVEQGKALAKYAIDAEGSYEKVNGGAVKGSVRVFESKIDHTEDHLVNYAREAQKLWSETNDIMTVTNAFIQYGINGPYHANAIIAKASRGQTDSFEIFAVSFGEVGLVGAPYEMFDTNGVFIKENSPFKMTIIAECANGANGYFPSEIAWDNNGYEVDTCKYMKGTAEDLANNFVEMLTALNAQ